MIRYRTLWEILISFLVIFFFTTATAISVESNPVVETIAGNVKGFVDKDNGILTFRGIHYGTSTAGSRRFLPPLPVESWDGEFEAMEYGPICPQGRSSIIPGTGERPRATMNEDCLVLNVWTPGLTGQRPVMVWLHGGGFTSGSGNGPGYDGGNLAKRGDVVVVTTNHRLNAFGYLHLADIYGEYFAGSGMAGMLDIELSLKWVRDNIRRFGGDPSNVTIFGESGGGAKVSTALAMPTSKGLFHKGIIQSGPGINGIDRDAATEVAESMATRLGVTNGGQLQQMPMEDILNAMAGTGEGGDRPIARFAPVVDGHYLPAHPFDPVASPCAAGVSIMIGSNRDEALLFLGRDPKGGKLIEKELIERVTPIAGEKTDDVIATYKKSRPGASPWDLFVAISSERFHLGSVKLADRKVTGSTAPVYRYLFDFEVNDRLKAAHAMEIAFVFRHVGNRFGAKPGAATLQDQISDAWIAFARSGNPNHPGLPVWPAYTMENRETMIFDVESRADNDPRGEEWRAWEGIDLRNIRR